MFLGVYCSNYFGGVIGDPRSPRRTSKDLDVTEPHGVESLAIVNTPEMACL